MLTITNIDKLLEFEINPNIDGVKNGWICKRIIEYDSPVGNEYNLAYRFEFENKDDIIELCIYLNRESDSNGVYPFENNLTFTEGAVRPSVVKDIDKFKFILKEYACEVLSEWNDDQKNNN